MVVKSSRLFFFTVAVSFFPTFGFGQEPPTPSISGTSAIVLNRYTGVVLGAKNPDVRRGMASTTKMMTALLAIERNGTALDTVYTVSANAGGFIGTTMNLRAGDRVSLRDLLYGLMLPSGNDAAIAIAEAVAGSEAAFVTLMNQRAQALGMVDTRYRNAHGLDPSSINASCDASQPNCGHFSTARDLARLARYALGTQPLFAQIVRTASWQPTSWVDGSGARRTNTLYNDNLLLSSRPYPGAVGVKTGMTASAGYCMVACANSSADSILTVVMNCASDTIRHAESAVLLDFGFANLGSAQTFTNGSFESDYHRWAASGNQEVVTFGTTDGAKAIRFNAGQRTPDGVLSQTFATTAGQLYTLAFDAGAYSPYGSKEQRLAVTVRGSQTLLSQVLNFAASGPSIGYSPKTFTFTADSLAATITFRDVSLTSDAVDLYLDDVVISQGGPVVAAPVITSQPQSVTVPAGANANFSVAATGHSLSYQWRLNGVNISGATASSYTLVNAQANHQGSYTVVVSNSGGSVTSAAAVLTVTTSTGGSGLANGSFESDYSGWSASGNQQVVPFGTTDGAKAVRFNAGQTTPNGILAQSFATTPGQAYTLSFDAGAYSPLGTKEQRLSIVVRGSQVLVSQVLSFVISGPNIGYSSKSFGFVADSSSATLSFEDVSPTSDAVDLYLDDVAVTAGGSSLAAPVITSQPQSVTVTAGASAAFSVVATGSGLSYQWRLNGGNISGATGSTYTIATAQSSHQGNYSVVVWNAGGSVTSAAAALTVSSGGAPSGGSGLLNGSFESEYSGWSVSGNQQIVSFGATDGTKAVRFNAGQTTPDGVLSQSFATVSGQSYTLSLDVGGYSPFSPKEQRMAVIVQGNQLLLAQTITHTAEAELTYTSRAFTFTADSSLTVLRLQDVSATTDAVDLYLDNVAVSSGATSGGGAGGGGTGGGGSGLINGSFESDYSGWSISGNQQIVPFGATDGVKAVRLNAGQTTPDGVLSQSIATTAGQSYTLSLDVGGYSPYSPQEQKMAVTIQGNRLLLAQTVIHLAGAELTYTRRSFTFTADSSVTVLRLQDISATSDAVDLYLDNVRVQSSL